MASTHDMVPNAGLLALDHVALRDRLGLLSQSREDEQAAEAASVEAVRAAMIADGFLNAEETSPEALTIAMHAWVAAGASQPCFSKYPSDMKRERAIWTKRDTGQPKPLKASSCFCMSLSGKIM